MSNPFDSKQPLELREAFLDKFSRELGAGCSPLERHETMTELRAHLDASASAYEELGLQPDEAMSAAIQSFGDAKTIGKGIVRESVGKPTIVDAPLLIAFAVPTIIGVSLMQGADALFVASRLVANRSPEMGMVGAIFGVLIGVCLYKRPRSPLVAALRDGLIAPTVLMTVICLLNRQFPGPWFMIETYICIGMANALTAAIASWVNETLARKYGAPRMG